MPVKNYSRPDSPMVAMWCTFPLAAWLLFTTILTVSVDTWLFCDIFLYVRTSRKERPVGPEQRDSCASGLRLRTVSRWCKNRWESLAARGVEPGAWITRQGTSELMTRHSKAQNPPLDMQRHCPALVRHGRVDKSLLSHPALYGVTNSSPATIPL